MIAEPITVSFEHPPIPLRKFDYCASFAGYEPGDPVGHGATRYDAILDLLMQADDEPPLADWIGR